MATTPSRPRRRDADRHHEAILTAAIEVLADAPQASMSQVARVSGSGRTTLYRHFPDRAALVDAIYARVLDEADSIVARRLAAAGPDGDPVEVIAQLGVTLAGLGDRYRFLEHHDEQLRAAGEDHRRRSEPLRRYLAAGRRSGRVRTDLELGWQFAMLVAAIADASKHRFASAPQRDRNLHATVTALLAPPPSA